MVKLFFKILGNFSILDTSIICKQKKFTLSVSTKLIFLENFLVKHVDFLKFFLTVKMINFHMAQV